MFTELYREEKKEEGDRGSQRRRGIKSREIDPGSSQFPKCYPLPRIPKECHRVR